ncbi:MAG: Rid family detoxifying hydrolase [Bariatricus sp.]|nr:Rid family detoxifying hydrolase [Bariatricus sp.]
MKLVATEKAPKALGPYSQGYVHNGILYSAGQIAINPETNDVEAVTIEQQTEQVCKNIGEVLKEAGSSFDKVLKTTCFLSDMGDFAAFNEVYGKYFTSKPARSCVAVKTLPKNVLCEVEVIAVVEE